MSERWRGPSPGKREGKWFRAQQMGFTLEVRQDGGLQSTCPPEPRGVVVGGGDVYGGKGESHLSVGSKVWKTEGWKRQLSQFLLALGLPALNSFLLKIN